MDAFLQSSFSGVGQGALFGLLGLGLVLIYRGSNTVNFAHAGIGVGAAYVFHQLWELWNWPALVAVPTTIVVVLAFATAMQLGIMRPLARAPQLAAVVATLGVLLILQAGAILIYGGDSRLPRSIFPSTDLFSGSVEILGAPIQKQNLWFVAITGLLAVGVWYVMTRTRLGAKTVAVAENEKGARLFGINPTRIALMSWWSGSLLAALAGILITPTIGLSADTMTSLLVPSLAAALVGRMRAFVGTWLAGLLIGMGKAYLLYLISDAQKNYLEPGLVEALPLVVIIVAMFVVGRRIPGRDEPGGLHSPRSPRVLRLTPPGLVVVFGVIAALILVLDRGWVAALTNSAIFGIIALSLVAITGFTGRISLAQMAFAGVAALITSALAHRVGLPLWAVIPLAGLAVVPLGFIVGLPAVRVRGVNLAIVTLAAGVAIEQVVLRSPFLSGGVNGAPVPIPSLFGMNLDSNRHPERFALFCLVVLFAVVVGMRALRRSQWGSALLAMRASERGSAASGIDVSRSTLMMFMLSAGMAGIGGSLMAYQAGNVSFSRFTVIASIFLLASVYITGVASVNGGLLAALMAAEGVSTRLFTSVDQIDRYWLLISGVLMVLTVLMNPDGIAVTFPAQLRHARSRKEAGHGQPSDGDGGTGPEPAERGSAVGAGAEASGPARAGTGSAAAVLTPTEEVT